MAAVISRTSRNTPKRERRPSRTSRSPYKGDGERETGGNLNQQLKGTNHDTKPNY